MEWDITYWSGDGIVYVKTRGTMSPTDLRQVAEAAFGEAAERGALKILADHRLVRHELPIVEIYRLPDLFRELGWSATHIVATVFSPEVGQAEDFTFFDNRAYNTGMMHRLFTDVDAARAWLVAQPPR